MTETMRVKTPTTDNTLKTVKNADGTGTVTGIGIYLADPGDPELIKDADGEFFTKDTYFGHSYEKVEALFNHAHYMPIYSNQRGAEAFVEGLLAHKFKHPATSKFDEESGHIVASLILDLAQGYERWVWDLCKKNALGWSSGAMQRRCRKNEETGQILEWPVIEYSLTPIPADIRTKVTCEKSFCAFLNGSPPPQNIQDWGEFQVKGDQNLDPAKKKMISVPNKETNHLPGYTKNIELEVALMRLRNSI